MEKKISVAAVAVAAAVTVAVAAFVLMEGDDDKGRSKISIGEIGTFVPIYGNATGDLYIDDDDTNALQSIIEGRTAWDRERAPYADANVDGVIDSRDVDIVKNIIAKNPCTVYYEDYYGDTTAVNFPLTNRNIAVTYYQQAEACAILGVLGDVKVASRAATAYSTMWPSLKEAVPWGTTGSSAITDDAVEKFIDNGVTLVVCTPRTENRELAQRLHDERGIDFIQLWYNGEYCISTIQTMAILMDRQDESKRYADYCNGVIDDLASKIKDKSAKRLLVISGYNSDNDQLSVLGNGRHGSYVLVNKYLGDAYTEDGTNQFGFVYHNVEWLVQNGQRFDAIVYCMSGSSGFSTDEKTGTYVSQDAYNRKFEETVRYFGKVGAYESGNVVGSEYPNTFGFSAYALLEIIAAQLYPGLFSLDDGVAKLQEWFDRINVVDIDVRTQGAYSYTGDDYRAGYPQL